MRHFLDPQAKATLTSSQEMRQKGVCNKIWVNVRNRDAEALVSGQEQEKYWQVMAQIQYAEEMGFDYTWAVEHHCLEEFSHCSAPEILFAAASQRTSTMRFGHGAVLLPQPYNHPIRVAERIGALDILSNQ